MKKLAALAAIALMLTAIPATAFAHGPGGGTKSANYSICSTKNCNIAGAHKHSRIYYTGHFLDDGHEYHEVCPVQGCTKTIAHIHDGNTYFGHHAEDGHTYHNSGNHVSRYNGGHHH